MACAEPVPLDDRNPAGRHEAPYRGLWPATATRPILGFAAYSGTGKTTLLRAVIPLLVERGVRVALVKHAHHGFDVDYPGKDSYELRKAGAGQVLVASAHRRALMTEHPRPRDPVLAEELACLHQDAVDLILVEGFRHERFPKIELRRGEQAQQPIAAHDDSVVAIATDDPARTAEGLPGLNINDPAQIAAFIVDRILDVHERT